MKMRLLAEAEAEAREAFQWYDAQRAGLGVEFLDALTQALETIEKYPRRFVRVAVGRPLREVRRALLKRFPYKVVFEVRADEVLVLAVAHVKRRPNYWKHRQER